MSNEAPPIQPTLGRIVHYTNMFGNLAPAMIIGTEATTSSEALARWIASGDAPEGVMEQPTYPSIWHVDLLVFGLGKDYREYRIPYGINDVFSQGNTKCWFYPPRV